MQQDNSDISAPRSAHETLPPRTVGPDGSAWRFWRNTRFSLLHQLVSMALAIILVPFLIWQLGTEKYGLWVMLQVFNIFGMLSLADLGLQGAIIRNLTRFHAGGDRYAFRTLLVTGFVMFLLIGTIAAVGVLIFAQTSFIDVFAVPAAYRDEMKAALSIYAAGLAVGFPALILKAFWASTQDVATQKVWELSDRIIFTIALVVALLFVSKGLVVMALVEVSVAAFLLAFFALLARRRVAAWFTFDLRLARLGALRGLGKLSGAVFATSVSNQVYVKAPEVFIGVVLGPVSLAHYQIATRLPRVLKSLQGSLNAAVLPHVLQIEAKQAKAAQNKDRRHNFFLEGLRLNFMFFTPLSVAAIVFAPEILMLWVGEEFANLSVYLALYAIWQLLSITVGFGGATLTQTAHYRMLVWRNLAINVVFLACLAIFTPNFGLSAVFAALLFAGLLTAASALAASRLANDFSYSKLLTKAIAGPVVVSGLVGSVLLWSAKLLSAEQGITPTIVCGGIGFAIYVLFIARFVAIGDERARLAHAIANRIGKK